MSMPFDLSLCYEFLGEKISQRFARPESRPPAPSHCQTFVGRVLAEPVNFGACTHSSCFSPRDSGLCIPGRELNPVSGCQGVSRTHCRAPLHPGRVGRLVITSPR